MFCSAIPTKVFLGDVYRLSKDLNPEYILKSVVCFLGAHYMTYIKKKNSRGKKIWKLYDDDRSIKEYKSWNDVLNQILDNGTLPTVLMYEKVSPQNSNDDISDQMIAADLYQLEKKAKYMQKFIDEFDI